MLKYTCTLLFLSATLVIEGVCGKTVNDVINIRREEFDDLKATVSCLETQQRESDKNAKDLQDVISQQAEQIQRHENIIIQQAERIQRHEDTITQQTEQIQRHEDTITQQAEQVQRHEDIITQQTEQIQRHEGIITQQTERIQRHEGIITQQAERIQHHEDSISRQAEQIQRHKKQSQQTVEVQSRPLTKENRSVPYEPKAKRHSENTVAFFATLTQASLDHLGLHQNLVFEDVVTNIGNAYNNHQGVFVAPISGLYLITTSVLSRQNKEFWAAVVVNGTEIVRLNGRGTDGRHGTGAQTMVITLKQGDDVSVQNVLQNDDDYWGDKYSSFGGFLIQEFETLDISSIVG